MIGRRALFGGLVFSLFFSLFCGTAFAVGDVFCREGTCPVAPVTFEGFLKRNSSEDLSLFTFVIDGAGKDPLHVRLLGITAQDPLYQDARLFKGLPVRVRLTGVVRYEQRPFVRVIPVNAMDTSPRNVAILE